VKRTRG